MIDIDNISKIVSFILALVGALALIFGVPSLLSSDPNPLLVVGGAVALAVGIAIAKIFE